ncbi:hypothetical protein [Nostocoides australiense]
MAKVERRLVVKGAFYDVECAVAANGVAPAAVFLDELKRGIWDGDPDDHDRPSDAQIHEYDLCLSLIADLARTGEPTYATAVNYLDDGLWELKFGNKRMTFFDTPGDGTYDAKPKIRDRRDAPYGSEYWWFPDFDSTLRLGHCFTKQDQKTDATDIAAAQRLREEDLKHDQSA